MKAFLQNYRRNRSGTTAVEFALIGIPFVLMIVAIVELALMFTVQSVVQQSTFNASRLIRTGQLQQSDAGGQEQMFQDAVCDFASLVVPCNQIQYQVERLNSFADAEDMEAEFDENGNLLDDDFDPGAENDIVLVRVTYNYPIRTPMMRPLLTNNANSTRSIISTVILQTEPYQQ
jgi:Flp pilus assembly protein TadG